MILSLLFRLLFKLKFELLLSVFPLFITGGWGGGGVGGNAVSSFCLLLFIALTFGTFSTIII